MMKSLAFQNAGATAQLKSSQGHELEEQEHVAAGVRGGRRDDAAAVVAGTKYQLKNPPQPPRLLGRGPNYADPRDFAKAAKKSCCVPQKRYQEEALIRRRWGGIPESE